MKNKLLIGTAVLLAGVAVASAQNAPGGGERHPQLNSAQERGQAQVPGRGGQAERQRDLTTGQAPSQREQGQAQQPKERSQTQGQREQGKAQQRNEQGQAQQRNERNQTTGQNPREQNQAQQPAQREGNQKTGQNPREQNQAQQPAQREGSQKTGQNPREQNQAQQPNQREGNQAAGQGEREQGTVRLNDEQRTRIREAMLSIRNVPRVDRVDFALTVGTLVPTYVHYEPIPETIIAMYPDWRGDDYFVVRDDIIVVDHEHKIIATVPVGGARAEVENRGTAFNASPAEIREMQMVLMRQGFDIGEVDGIMGPRTREALMAFQRQKGMRATGEIDQQTFVALGIHEGGHEGNVGPATTGQSPNTQPSGNKPSDKQQPLAKEPGENRQGQPATSGQGNRGTTGQNPRHDGNPSATSPQNSGNTSGTAPRKREDQGNQPR
jgi:hypothetical protein